MSDKIVERIESIEKELIGIKEELHKQNNEKEEPIVHLMNEAKLLIYDMHTTYQDIPHFLKLKFMHIGDKIAIPMKNYILELVIVNIESNVDRYYLMPTNNIDVRQMHHEDCYIAFENTDMDKYLYYEFRETFFTNINRPHMLDVTLASKEEIFDQDKAFPYFKKLFKEHRFVEEFGHRSIFWLRSITPFFCFYYVDSNGYFSAADVDNSNSCGLRPLIIVE